MAILSPFVYWAQNESNLFLKVDLKDAKNPDIVIEQKSIYFKALGTGAQGTREYSFNLGFFKDIDTNEQNINVRDNSISIKLYKVIPSWWPRLISTPQKPTWLKIDFDRWQTEDDVLEEKVNDIREDFPDIYEKLQKNELGYLKEDFKAVYLVMYNFLMLCGFTYVFSVMVMLCIKAEFRNDGPLFSKTYANVGQIMCILHLFQILEIMHPIFGYVKGSALFPAMQIGGRLFILFGHLEFEPQLQKMPVTTYLFFTWSSIELIRYSYYIVHMADSKRMGVKKYLFPPLEWLRYSAWIILYPCGFICEAVVIFRNMIYLHQNPRGSITLPNKYNFTFDYLIFLRIYMLFFMLPGMYTLIRHMYNIRVKKLGGNQKFLKLNPFKWKTQ